MLNLYDNPEELTFELDELQTKNNNVKIVDKLSIKQVLADKWSIKESLADKLADIVVFASEKESFNTEDVVTLLSTSETSAKRYLRQLIDIGLVSSDGANRNRTYSLVDRET